MDTKITFECNELRVVVWKPGSAPPGVKRNYGVEAEIRGKALSTSETGMDVIETLRTALEGMLFPEMGDTPEQRRKELAPHTFPGHTDVAVDVEQVGRGAERYARREVFFSDDEDERTNHWVCRGSAPSHIRDLSGDGMEHEEVKGNGPSGRTLLRKGKRHRVVIYEKAKVKDRSRKASEVLKRIWAKNGWSGSSNMLRVELRIHAEWISREMYGINYDEFLRILWKLARRLAKRDRHLAYDPLSEQRKSRRPLSPLWEAMRHALKRLRPVSK